MIKSTPSTPATTQQNIDPPSSPYAFPTASASPAKNNVTTPITTPVTACRFVFRIVIA